MRDPGLQGFAGDLLADPARIGTGQAQHPDAARTRRRGRRGDGVGGERVAHGSAAIFLVM